MSLRVTADPYGYRKLLVYEKAEILQKACAEFTSRFPRLPPYTLSALADQMDRSARSVKQNIVEGWKRNSTKEYYDFLGFSLGANAELEEGCNDIIKGMYRGLKGEEMGIEKVEKLPFFPRSPLLSPLVQLKLQCKEMNFLLQRLQRSLENKQMERKKSIAPDSRETRWLADQIEAAGMTRLPDGRIVPKGTKGM